MGDEREGDGEHEGVPVAAAAQSDPQPLVATAPQPLDDVAPQALVPAAAAVNVGPPPEVSPPLDTLTPAATPPAATPPAATPPAATPPEGGWRYTPHPAFPYPPPGHPGHPYPPPHYPAAPPPPGYYPPGADHEAGRQRLRQPRLEYNESGGCSLVAERVPPSVNKFEMLHAHFQSLGTVTNLQLNHNRHEAIVTYATMEEAHRALMYPVLQDPDIGLRPWRSKPGQRGPGTPSDKDRERDRTQSAAHPVVGSSPGVKPGGKGSGSVSDPRQRTPEKPAGNLMLETPAALAQKRKANDMEDRRKALLQNLTDQLKTVLTKLNDPKLSDKNRETLQTVLNSIRSKIDQVTPPQKERVVRQKLGHQTWEPPKPGDMAAGSAVSSVAAASSDAVVIDSPAHSASEAPAPTFHSPALPPATIAEDPNAELPPDFDAEEPEMKDAEASLAKVEPAIAAETAETPAATVEPTAAAAVAEDV